MSNQYTMIKYTNDEVEQIVSFYNEGMSFTKISKKLNRQKNTIKKILIDCNIFIEGKNSLNKYFTNNDIDTIKEKYSNGESCQKIAMNFNTSKVTIGKLLKSEGLLRKGYSNGVKIELNDNTKELIKHLYLNEYKSPLDISKMVNLNVSFINKYLTNSGYRRNKSESISLTQKGKKRTEEVCKILKIAQQTLAKSGNRKQTGGACKKYIINGIECTGTYEKFYIEKLIIDGQKTPINSESVNTPYGVYYPDFLNDETYIEIKSDYTYDVLIGRKINRWTKKIDTTQLKKIKWVNENIKPVDILVVDKKHNKIIKK